MNTIKQWLVKYSVWTHILAFCGFLVAAFDELPEFHNFVIQIYSSLPPSLVKWIAVGLALYAWYRKGEPTTSTTPAVKKTPCIILTLLMFSTLSYAQTVAPSPTGFVASSDAMAISCKGSWGAGNLTTESYDLLDYGKTKSSRLFAQGIELTAPNCGLSIFGGGFQLQPDLSSLLKSTNIPVGNLLVFIDGSLGNGIPSTGSDHLSSVIGGGVKYILSDNVTWNTAEFQEVFFGASRYPSVSMGISAYFGGTPASAVASPNVKRSLIKRIASATKNVQ